MDNDQFDAIVRDTIDALPAWVHDALENIEILIFDEPDEELGPEARDLLGLYTGVPLPERSVEDSGDLPDVIYVFRRAHLELGLSPNELRDEIAATLIHEIAHYFGIDDDQLDELGWG
ncbi:MAG: metallopeptidase family protein [Gammaproteobacteria bacterium]